MSPRQLVAFFAPIGFAPLGGSERQYNTRKGNTARRLVTVLKLPPAPLKNGDSALLEHQSCNPHRRARAIRYACISAPSRRRHARHADTWRRTSSVFDDDRQPVANAAAVVACHAALPGSSSRALFRWRSGGDFLPWRQPEQPQAGKGLSATFLEKTNSMSKP